MRISTNMMFESGTKRISTLQAEMLKTQAQISADRRVLTPSDDPIAAARALEVTQSQTINAQYAKNCQTASDSLNSEENVLKSVTTLIQDVQTLIVEAGNAAYDDEQRGYIATELEERFKELMGYANTKDNEGNYLFSGFKTNTAAFASTATGVNYTGDQGQRMLQVGAVRQLAISDTGDAVFGRMLSNKMFVSAAQTTPANTGTGTVSPLAITDATQLTGHSYSLRFTSATNYEVYDTTLDPGMTGTALTSGTYTSGEAIEFDGLQMTISEVPATGDVFTVSEAASTATDAVMVQTGTDSVFGMMSDLITLLQSSAATSDGKQALNNGLALATENFSNALDKTLTVRASVGARLKELESLESASDDRDLLYAGTLTDLVGLDGVKAVSELTLQKTTLEAAQQSYVAIMGLSLFNYL